MPPIMPFLLRISLCVYAFVNVLACRVWQSVSRFDRSCDSNVLLKYLTQMVSQCHALFRRVSASRRPIPWRTVNRISDFGHFGNIGILHKLIVRFLDCFVLFEQFDVFIRLYVLYLCHYVIYI